MLENINTLNKHENTYFNIENSIEDYFEILAETNDYWGRDDDTHELILSPNIDLEFKGEIVLEVKRDISLFVDFENDFNYSSVDTKTGRLKQTS